jgi:hypothetical protein
VRDFRFDAVEICGGSGVLSAALIKEGLTACTPIDLSRSEHFNLQNIKLTDWIVQMIFGRRFKGVVAEPVCTTVSPAQHPASPWQLHRLQMPGNTVVLLSAR